jgi:hypothetical protein
MRPSSPARGEPDIDRMENHDGSVVPDGPTAANVSGPHPTKQSARAAQRARRGDDTRGGVRDGRLRLPRRVPPPPG